MSDERDQKALQLTKRNQQFKSRIATLEKRQEQLDTEHKRLGKKLNRYPVDPNRSEAEKDRFQKLRQRYDRVGKLSEKNRATLKETRQKHKDFQQKHQSGKDATHESPSHNLGHKKNEQGNYRARGRVTDNHKKGMGAIQRQKQVPGQKSQTTQTTPKHQTQTPSPQTTATGKKDSLATYKTNQKMNKMESKTPGQQKQKPDLSNVKKLETHGQQRKNTLAKYQSGKSSTHKTEQQKQTFAGKKQTGLGAYARSQPNSNRKESQTDISKSTSQKSMSNQQTNQQQPSTKSTATVKKNSMSKYSTQGGAGKGAGHSQGKGTSTPPPSKGQGKGQGR